MRLGRDECGSNIAMCNGFEGCDGMQDVPQKTWFSRTSTFLLGNAFDAPKFAHPTSTTCGNLPVPIAKMASLHQTTIIRKILKPMSPTTN